MPRASFAERWANATDQDRRLLRGGPNLIRPPSGPTLEAANEDDRFRTEQMDQAGLIQPTFDPVNVLSGGLAGAATGGVRAGLSILPGMMATELPISMAIDKATEYTGGNPYAEMAVNIALSVIAGKFFEPHVNRAAGKVAKDMSRFGGSEVGTFVVPGTMADKSDWIGRYNKALAMEEMKYDPREIWEKTGMMNYGGKWLDEITDNTMTVKSAPERLAELKDYHDTKIAKMKEFGMDQKLIDAEIERMPTSLETTSDVDQVINHPAILEHLPDLESDAFMFRDLPSGQLGARNVFGLVGNTSLEKGWGLETTALHELQHMVQAKQGLQGGTNPQEALGSFSHSGMTQPEIDAKAFKNYQDDAGETLARLSAHRRIMTPEQRAQSYPLDQLEEVGTKLDDLQFSDRIERWAAEESRLPLEVEPMSGSHWQKKIYEDNTVRGPSPDRYNAYSKNDVGNRVDMATEGNPYNPRGYGYVPGQRPETTVRSLNNVVVGVDMPEGILDLGKGVPNGWDEIVGNFLAKGPSGGNAADNALNKLGYRGMMDRERGIFYGLDPMKSQNSVDLGVGVSDITEGFSKPFNTLSSAKEYQDQALSQWVRNIETTLKKGYPEIRLGGVWPTIGRFGGATSGVIEPSVKIALHGPPKALFSSLSEIAMAKHQREVFAMGAPDMDLGGVKVWPGLRLTGNFERGTSLEEIQKLLENSKISNYNIIESDGAFGIDTFLNKPSDALPFKDMLKYEKISPVGSVSAGDGSIDHANIQPAFDNYQSHMENYFGKTKGSELAGERAKEGTEWAGF